MKIDPAQNADVLSKRVRRLLQLERPERSPFCLQVLPFLESLGSVALIGGAIRDVARAGKKAFSSDLDFVVHKGDHATFVRAMIECGAKRNKFGGYALSCFRPMKVDIWHIEDTWARTAGLTTVETINDLLKCTFFDWDSALYDLSSGKLFVPPDYFQRLGQHVMDIRLEPNPNPKGSIVRALRRAALWNVKFGTALSAFATKMLTETRWDELVALDARAFSFPVLKYLDPESLLCSLRVLHSTPVGYATLPVPVAQLQLPFSRGT